MKRVMRLQRFICHQRLPRGRSQKAVSNSKEEKVVYTLQHNIRQGTNQVDSSLNVQSQKRMQKYKADMIPFSVPHNAHVQHKPKPLARTAFDLSKA